MNVDSGSILGFWFLFSFCEKLFFWKYRDHNSIWYDLRPIFSFRT